MCREQMTCHHNKEKNSMIARIYKWDESNGSKMFKFAARNAFRLFKQLFAFSHVPLIQKIVPAIDPEKTDLSWIPINKNIEGSDGIALPMEIVDRLIDLCNEHVIIDFCTCRKVYACKHYPEEIGCLFMGPTARKIWPKYSRSVTREEAKAHLRKAVAAGLVPIVGEAHLDHDLLFLPFERSLLTCCFCCECCCVTRFFRRGHADVVNRIMEPIDGLSIEITGDCIGCGKCVKKCYIEALDLKDGKAVKNEYCTLCGRCAGVCPENAIRIKLDNPNAADDVIKRILGRINLA